MGRRWGAINRIVVMTTVGLVVTVRVVSIPSGLGCGKDEMIFGAFIVGKLACSSIAAHERDNKAVFTLLPSTLFVG